MNIQLIITTIVTGLVIASVTAIVNIKVKYAQNAAHATREVALIFWKIIYWPSLLSKIARNCGITLHRIRQLDGYFRS
ncbi:MAG: hypothetical protein ACYDH1_20695, partial [Anaerolineaceae bacterium]